MSLDVTMGIWDFNIFDYCCGQVEWELEGLELCDIIIMYFDSNTKSPISLLELGLFAHKKKMIVFCPNGFWRKGNVDVVCKVRSYLSISTS